MSNNGWSNQTNTRLIIVEGTPFSGLFFYAPAPGAGNLIGSWTAAAGTDPYGNAYPAGLSLETPTLSQVVLNAVNNIITETFITGNPDLIASGFIQANVQGVGANQVDTWQVVSAQNNLNRDTAGLFLQSNNNLDSLPAEAILFYAVPGNRIPYLTVTDSGVTVTAGLITAVEAGTGTSPLNVATPAAWHKATLTGNWTGSGNGVNGLWYKLMPDKTLHLVCDLQVPNTPGNIFTLGTGYIPNTTQNVPAGSYVGSDAPHLMVSNVGVISATAFGASGTAVVCNARIPLDL